MKAFIMVVKDVLLTLSVMRSYAMKKVAIRLLTVGKKKEFLKNTLDTL